MRYQLTAADRDGLHELWRRMRHASHQTNLASAKWNRISDEINDLAARSRWSDDVTAANRNASRALNDALSAWSFWEREVSRLAATLQAEYVVRTMFGLVDADEPDETGLLYQRDDEGDEPVRRPTRPHVGFSIVSPGRAEAAARRRTSSPAGQSSAPPVAGRPPQGRPGPQQPDTQAGASASGTGGTVVAGASTVPPALRGERGIW